MAKRKGCYFESDSESCHENDENDPMNTSESGPEDKKRKRPKSSSNKEPKVPKESKESKTTSRRPENIKTKECRSKLAIAWFDANPDPNMTRIRIDSFRNNNRFADELVAAFGEEHLIEPRFGFSVLNEREFAKVLRPEKFYASGSKADQLRKLFPEISMENLEVIRNFNFQYLQPRGYPVEVHPSLENTSPEVFGDLILPPEMFDEIISTYETEKEKLLANPFIPIVEYYLPEQLRGFVYRERPKETYEAIRTCMSCGGAGPHPNPILCGSKKKTNPGKSQSKNPVKGYHLDCIKDALIKQAKRRFCVSLSINCKHLTPPNAIHCREEVDLYYGPHRVNMQFLQPIAEMVGCSGCKEAMWPWETSKHNCELFRLKQKEKQTFGAPFGKPQLSKKETLGAEAPTASNIFEGKPVVVFQNGTALSGQRLFPTNIGSSDFTTPDSFEGRIESETRNFGAKTEVLSNHGPNETRSSATQVTKIEETLSSSLENFALEDVSGLNESVQSKSVGQQQTTGSQGKEISPGIIPKELKPTKNWTPKTEVKLAERETILRCASAALEPNAEQSLVEKTVRYLKYTSLKAIATVGGLQKDITELKGTVQNLTARVAFQCKEIETRDNRIKTLEKESTERLNRSIEENAPVLKSLIDEEKQEWDAMVILFKGFLTRLDLRGNPFVKMNTLIEGEQESSTPVPTEEVPMPTDNNLPETPADSDLEAILDRELNEFEAE